MKMRGGFILITLLVGALLIWGFDDKPATTSNATPVPTQQAAVTIQPLASVTPSPASTVSGVVAGREVAVVARIVDGDTVELADGRKVRYIGIDTPETVDPRKPVQCIGPEATKKNRDLVEGKEVMLERDVNETDRLGRLLRYVYVGDVFVNEVLVREGFAKSSKYPPDTKHQKLFDEAEQYAEQQQWGLWSDLCSAPATVSLVASGSQGECSIKGNINSDNEKIYHTPGCGSYEKTQINTARGERYFCTEQEAQNAGWRKAGNC